MRVSSFALPSFLLLSLSACIEPEQVNHCIAAVDDLSDIHRWDPQLGGVGPGDPYRMLISADPKKSVPYLIRGLTSVTPTKIEDGLHPVPTVGDVCFHALLAIFQMTATDFEREGVGISKRETDPIYMILIVKPETRVRLQQKFTKLAEEREWLTPE